MEQGPTTVSERSAWRGLLGTAAVSLVVATFVHLLVVQVFVIPSSSMAPTLEPGDRVVVEKVSSKFGSLERGAIVVFDRPAALEGTTAEDHLIKRVIGLPGETVSGENGEILVDGAVLTDPWASSRTVPFSAVDVPSDSYFLMGDNRSGSQDSRYFGPVLEADVVGVARLGTWPLNRLGPL